jgi:dethiobiotin synthetase
VSQRTRTDPSDRQGDLRVFQSYHFALNSWSEHIAVEVQKQKIVLDIQSQDVASVSQGRQDIVVVLNIRGQYVPLNTQV